eukprot:EG_transcript_24628
MAPKQMSKEERAAYYKKKRDKERQKQQKELKATKAEQGQVLGRQRDEENAKLKARLTEKGLVYTSVPSDGHCMYRALEHQLKLLGRAQGGSYQELRQAAAEYIRRHPDAFAPFLMSADGEPLTAEEFEEYLRGVEGAAWGDNPELQALAHSLRSRIVVLTAEGPEHVFGAEYAAEGDTMMLTYHRHLHTLGEHYNSAHPPDVEVP